MKRAVRREHTGFWELGKKQQLTEKKKRSPGSSVIKTGIGEKCPFQRSLSKKAVD